MIKITYISEELVAYFFRNKGGDSKSLWRISNVYHFYKVLYLEDYGESELDITVIMYFALNIMNQKECLFN
jgi:hypothetical protein